MRQDRHRRHYGRRRRRHYDDDFLYEEQPTWRRPLTVARYWTNHPWAYDPLVVGLGVPAAKKVGQAIHARSTARFGTMSHQQQVAYVQALQADITALKQTTGTPMSVRAAAYLKFAWAQLRTQAGWVQGLIALLILWPALLATVYAVLWVGIAAPFLAPVPVALAAWVVRARHHKIGLARYLSLTAKTLWPTVTKAERRRARTNHDGTPAATLGWVSRVTGMWLSAALRHERGTTTLLLVTVATSGITLALKVAEVTAGMIHAPWGDVPMLLGLIAAATTAGLFGIARRRRTTAMAALAREVRRGGPGTDLTKES